MLMMSESRIQVTAEVHFAQHLASNQKKIRDRAFKRLQRWLTARSSCENAFKHEDMMKLWKGLFYCMWMSDKPLIQENLADSMSKLVHRFSRIEYAYMFIECFLQTMSREWFGLDKFRLEKFMMLIRRFLRQSFELLRKQNWDEDNIKYLLEILENNVFASKMNSTLVSLKSHIIDIFLEELARIGGNELLPDQMKIFLHPFCKIMAKTDNPVLLSDIARNIFEFIIYQNDDRDVEDFTEEQNGDTEETNNKEKLECEEKLPILQVNYEDVANFLFILAKKKNVKKTNRTVMYKLVKKFKDLSQGVAVSEFDEVLSSGTDLDENDISVAINRLQEDQEKCKQETEKWKMSRKCMMQESHKQAKIANKNKRAKMVMDFDEGDPDGVSNVMEDSLKKYKWETSERKNNKKNALKKKMKNNIDGKKFNVASKNKKFNKSLISKSKNLKKKQKSKINRVK